MASAGKSSGATPIGRRGPKTGSNVAVRTIPAQLESGTAAMDPAVADTPDLGSTPDLNFEPSALFESGRTAMAPALRAQQEAFKALERFGRYHYAVAGDYLEWGVAQARAIFAPGTPAEHVASQTTLATQFGEKLQGRVREFVSLASETRATFNELVGDATARFAETIKRFA
jgi:Phasin protein